MFPIERKPSVISSDFALFGNPTLVISSSIVSVNVVNPPGGGEVLRGKKNRDDRRKS